jgi:hypothetical protein
LGSADDEEAQVRGDREDDLGDIHSFHTDDRERAEEIAEVMREDLERVELTEH